jgi:hypothetical protein
MRYLSRCKLNFIGDAQCHFCEAKLTCISIARAARQSETGRACHPARPRGVRSSRKRSTGAFLIAHHPPAGALRPPGRRGPVVVLRQPLGRLAAWPPAVRHARAATGSPARYVPWGFMIDGSGEMGSIAHPTDHSTTSTFVTNCPHFGESLSRRVVSS